MTRINLLPPEQIKERRGRLERNYLWLAIAAPALVLVLVIAWWFSMNGEMSSKNETLAQANRDLADMQARTSALKQYKDQQAEIAGREATVVQALSGRVYWARILNNIGIMCPPDVWLTSISGTASGGAGQVQFEGRATQCPNRLLGGFYPGMRDYHPDFRPVAAWIERMSQVEQFERVWMSTAEPNYVGDAEGVSEGTVVTRPGGAWIVRFSAMAALNMKNAAIGAPVAAPAAAPAPAPRDESGTEGGGEQ